MDFPDDLKLGLNLGFYRTFAVPAIARVLVGTGKMMSRPKVRAKATGTMMYTLIDNGFHSPAGRETVAALNQLHARLPVGNDEFVYVLATFCVTPLRWIDEHGWRHTTTEEKAAAHGFFLGLAQRMGIQGVPDSYSALARWMDDFEERQFAVTEEGRALLEATRGLLSDRFPKLAAPVVRVATDALIDARLRAALGASDRSVVIRWLVTTALRLRAAHLRHQHRGELAGKSVSPMQ
ncbi:oxygenase MpaB family protein [Streptomyces acidicola]|uniref:oxygenase MpaB family protein n=1 Tax=Streptomyces acidicola TaxID=2596892 RepID=UPI0037FF633D